MRNWESVNDQIREGSPNFTWTGTECKLPYLGIEMSKRITLQALTSENYKM